jgi:hypothetical protein
MAATSPALATGWPPIDGITSPARVPSSAPGLVGCTGATTGRRRPARFDAIGGGWDTLNHAGAYRSCESAGERTLVPVRRPRGALERVAMEDPIGSQRARETPDLGLNHRLIVASRLPVAAGQTGSGGLCPGSPSGLLGCARHQPSLPAVRKHYPAGSWDGPVRESDC